MTMIFGLYFPHLLIGSKINFGRYSSPQGAHTHAISNDTFLSRRHQGAICDRTQCRAS